jgi:hypothetical protein
MRVGIIGSGTVGPHHGAGFVKHRHEVGTRDPGAWNHVSRRVRT